MTKENLTRLWNIGFDTIKELETENGILASGKDEIFGCVFGRDCLITCLNLIEVYKKTNDEYFLTLIKKVLVNLTLLQGKEINIESGEQPGKCIHEFRTNNHEHLTKLETNPWFVYLDGNMRNYDTVDATPLLLITIYKYYNLTKDEVFMADILPNVQLALDWLLIYGDSNGDGFIDYGFHPERVYGGLKTQSWMDSGESVFHEDGELVEYPIAPVEVQSYTFVAYKMWSNYYKPIDTQKSTLLNSKAEDLKKNFNRKFVSIENNDFSVHFAIDGSGKPLVSPRSSIGHCLWNYFENENGVKESILENKYLSPLVSRLMKPDLFEPDAGIRTLSALSNAFDPKSYHNGSIWPHDTAIIIEGLKNFGFYKESNRIRNALMSAYEHFQTPIELFVYNDGKFEEYCSASGQKACKKQAWSAASLLSNISTFDYITKQ